ncbi:MAG: glutaredoxin family protein [Candidatus Thorarchaeota archaeon]|nr:glutaredoxin family protein [Candidatus Thorarchaeota archaeon]
MPKVFVYTAPECPHSENLKKFLSELGVEVEEKCIIDNPNARDEIKKLTGQMGIPVAVIDGEIYVGFDRRAERRIKRKLGV